MNCLFENSYENIDDSNRIMSFSKKKFFFDNDDAKRRRREAKKLQNDKKDSKITNAAGNMGKIFTFFNLDNLDL